MKFTCMQLNGKQSKEYLSRLPLKLVCSISFLGQWSNPSTHRVFTAKQARFIVKHVPRGRDKNTPIEKNLRIDMAVMLYPRIRDLENFEQVSRL